MSLAAKRNRGKKWKNLQMFCPRLYIVRSILISFQNFNDTSSFWEQQGWSSYNASYQEIKILYTRSIFNNFFYKSHLSLKKAKNREWHRNHVQTLLQEFFPQKSFLWTNASVFLRSCYCVSCHPSLSVRMSSFNFCL